HRIWTSRRISGVRRRPQIHRNQVDPCLPASFPKCIERPEYYLNIPCHSSRPPVSPVQNRCLNFPGLPRLRNRNKNLYDPKLGSLKIASCRLFCTKYSILGLNPPNLAFL